MPVGHREAVVGAELTAHGRRADGVGADHGAGVLRRPGHGAAVVVADHGLVGATEQLEWAGQVDLRRLLGGVGGAVQAVEHRAAAILVPVAAVAATARRVDLGQPSVIEHLGGALGGLEVEGPVVVEAMLQGAEGGAGGVLAEAPARHQIGAARQIGLAAVAVPDRDVGTPTTADHFVVFVLIAGAQGGGVIQVEFEVGQGRAGALGLVVAERVGILLGHDETRTQATILGQRQVEVGAQTAFVPTAIGGVSAAAEGLARGLADQVDGSRGVAGAAEQAVGAADDVDALVQVHVQGVAAAAEVGAALELQAVDLPVADRVATGAEIGTPAHFRLAAGHPWSGVQRLLEVANTTVIHLLAGDGGDRLRGLPWGQLEPGGTAAALDGVTELPGIVRREQGAVLDLGGLQFQRLTIGGHGAGTQAQGDTQGKRAEAATAAGVKLDVAKGAVGFHLGRLRIRR